MGLSEFFKGVFGVGKSKLERKVTPEQRERFDEYDAQYQDTHKGRLIAEMEDYLRLYGNHSWVHSCARDVAQAAASVEYQLLKDGKEVKKKDKTPIGKLLKQPNPFDTWYDFIYLTFLHLELGGNCFWEVVREKKSGQIIGLYILKPHQMEIVPHPKKKVAGYKYKPNPQSTIVYGADEIIHLKYVNPLDDYWGMSVFMAAQVAITLDFYAQGWNKSFFQQGAEPGGTLETDQSLSPQAYERLLSNWYKRHQGLKNAHIPAVLEEGLKYKSITMKHSEMEFDAMRHMTKEEIYETAGVPMGWASKPAEKKAFWLDNIIPKLNKLEQAINLFLLKPEEDEEDKDNLEFKFVTRSILSMVEDDQVKSQIANQNVTHGIMTINEVRERYYGLPPVEWGDTYWAPVGLAPWDSGLHPNTPAGPNDKGQTIDNENEGGNHAGLSHPSQVPKVDQKSRLDSARGAHPEVSKSFDGNQRTDIDALEVADPEPQNKLKFWMWNRWTTWAKASGSDERKLSKAVRDAFEKQYKGLKRKLKGKWKYGKDVVRKADPDLEGEIEDLLLELEIEAENAEFIAKMKEVGAEIVGRQGNILMGQLNLGISYAPQNARIIKWLDEWGGSKVTKINNYTRTLIKDALVKSATEGEDFEAMLARLGQIFGPDGGIALSRAQKIARTELVTLSNEARLDAARETGVVSTKMWVSELLPTTRQELNGPNHAEMHGVVIPIEENFLVKNRSGVDHMHGPGDLSASAENVVNCLCLVEFPPDDESFAELFEENTTREDRTGRVGKRKKSEEEVNVNIHVHTADGKVEIEKGGSKPEPQPIIINMPKQEPPVVHVEAPKIFVKPADVRAPDVHVTSPDIRVEAPQVHIENKQETPVVKVDVAPANVQVDVKPELRIPPTIEETRVIRDEKNPGKIIGSIKETREKE